MLNTKQRAEELRTEIARHSHLYHEEAAPEITDAEFDALVAELKSLNPEELLPVGAPKITDGKVKHRRKMLSLDNVYSAAELIQWLSKIKTQLGQSVVFAVEPKVDGLALSLQYVDGVLVGAATRGDGTFGEDVLMQAKAIGNIPQILPIPVPGEMEIRGEVVMRWVAFGKLNDRLASEGLPVMANARNAAAGAMKLKDFEEVKSRGLSFVAYYVDRGEGQTADLDVLQSEMGFETPQGRYPSDDHMAILAHVLRIGKPAFREQMGYSLDGAVIKVDAAHHRKELGESTRSPNWAVAYKYPPERVTTVLEGVEFQLGRTGAITPVAVLRPVSFSGSTVSRATLHNFDQVKKLDLRINDTVWLEKSAEIIPAVVGVVDPSQRTGGEMPIACPTTCPSCGLPVSDARCLAPACPDVMARRIEYFGSSKCMDIRGMGPAVISRMVLTGMVTSPADLFSLTPAVLITRGVCNTQYSAEKLCEAIANSKSQPAHRVLASLGIPGVGTTVAPALVDSFSDGIVGFLHAAAHTPDVLESIDGFGKTSVASVAAWLYLPGNARLVESLKIHGLKMLGENEAPVSDVLAGTTWVVTGELSIGRDTIHRLIISHGGAVASSVTKKVTHLLVGDAPGNKLKQAQEKKKEIVDEAGFRSKLGMMSTL